LFKKYTTVLSAAFLMLFSSYGLANDLSYSHLDITHKKSDSGDSDVSVLQHALSFEVSDSLFVAGNLTYGDYEVTTFDLSVGEHSSINENTDLVSTVSYSWIKYDDLVESEDLEAFEFSVGLRSMVAERFELSAGVAYVDVSSNSPTSYRYLGAAFYATETLSLRVDYMSNDPTLSASESLNADSMSFSLRLNM
jgi:hypothetical protein